MAQLARLAEGKGAPVADLLVIDTPPGDAATVQASIDAAALVVIPSPAAPLDIQRVWPTLQASYHRNRAVLITSAEPRTRAHAAALEILEQEGEPVFATMIPRGCGPCSGPPRETCTSMTTSLQRLRRL